MLSHMAGLCGSSRLSDCPSITNPSPFSKLLVTRCPRTRVGTADLIHSAEAHMSFLECTGAVLGYAVCPMWGVCAAVHLYLSSGIPRPVASTGWAPPGRAVRLDPTGQSVTAPTSRFPPGAWDPKSVFTWSCLRWEAQVFLLFR